MRVGPNKGREGGENELLVNTESGPVCLHELEQNELGSFVHARSTGVFRTVTFQWDLGCF